MLDVTQDDRALFRRWLECRDAEAFATIVTRHSAMVYATCKRILHNAADAEDAAQECFLRLAQAHTPVRASLTGWLHTLATHCSLDRIKADARRRLLRTAHVRARQVPGRPLVQ